MAHLNSMIGIVNQAIIELENNITSPGGNTIHNSTATPTADKTDNIYDWHEMPLGKIAIGVITTVIGASVLYLIAIHLGLKLN